jgi:hypothetical protein
MNERELVQRKLIIENKRGTKIIMMKKIGTGSFKGKKILGHKRETIMYVVRVRDMRFCVLEFQYT